MGVTTNFAWTYPTEGGSTDTWGATLNTFIIALDANMFALGPASAGTINNMVIGGSTPKAGTFTTLVGVDTTLTGNVTVTTANKAVNFSPTGTGTVTINPSTASAINNVTIGASTPLAGNFTTLGTTGNVAVGLNETVAGNLTTTLMTVAGGGLTLSPLRPSQLVGNVTDYNPTGLANASALSLTSSSSWNINGIVAPSRDGRVLPIWVTSGTVVLKNNAGSAGNKMLLPGAADITLAGRGINLVYDLTAAAWYALGDA